MSSNLSQVYADLSARGMSLHASITATKRKRDDTLHRLGTHMQALAEHKEEHALQSTSIEVLKEIIDQMSREHIEKVQSLVTFALQTIFYDRDYALEIEVEDKRNNKSAEFYLVEQRPDGALKASFNDSIGGGILSVVGFVLQVFYISYFKLRPIIFCDESFSQLSEQYIDGLMEFIEKLAEKKEFRVVLISHDPRLIPKAQKVYRVTDGLVTVEEAGNAS